MEEKKIKPQTRGGLTARARRMRRDGTEAEAKLWDKLRRKKFSGFKFRRQHLIGPYIVDFCCPARKLVIELDGPIHEAQKAYDRKPEDDLIGMGYQVIRFRNEDVMEDFATVLNKILAALDK